MGWMSSTAAIYTETMSPPPGVARRCQFSGKVWFLKNDPIVVTERTLSVPALLI